MVKAVLPERGIGGGVAAGRQETSEVQPFAPAPLATTQALLRHSLWVGVTVTGGGGVVTQLASLVQESAQGAVFGEQSTAVQPPPRQTLCL